MHPLSGRDAEQNCGRRRFQVVTRNEKAKVALFRSRGGAKLRKAPFSGRDAERKGESRPVQVVRRSKIAEGEAFGLDAERKNELRGVQLATRNKIAERTRFVANRAAVASIRTAMDRVAA